MCFSFSLNKFAIEKDKLSEFFVKYFLGTIRWIFLPLISCQLNNFVSKVNHAYVQSISQNLTDIQFTNALDVGKVLWNGRYIQKDEILTIYVKKYWKLYVYSQRWMESRVAESSLSPTPRGDDFQSIWEEGRKNKRKGEIKGER